MTFWCGSGSVDDPCLRLMDPDADPSIFIIDLQDAKKANYLKSVSAYYFFKVLLHHFSQVKTKKEVTKQKKSRFFLTIFA